MPAIMENFPEVQSCIECSAKAMYNIAEMFCYAQKAVLYPTALLYSAEEQDVRIVWRIFFLLYSSPLVHVKKKLFTNFSYLLTFSPRAVNGQVQERITAHIQRV